MNKETGVIISHDAFLKLEEKEKKKYIEMKKEATEKQLKRKPPRVNKNEPCPCGSGKKFKNCHLKN